MKRLLHYLHPVRYRITVQVIVKFGATIMSLVLPMILSNIIILFSN